MVKILSILVIFLENMNFIFFVHINLLYYDKLIRKYEVCIVLTQDICV